VQRQYGDERKSIFENLCSGIDAFSLTPQIAVLGRPANPLALFDGVHLAR